MVGPVITGSVGATGQFQLGEAAAGRVSSWLVQFQSASFSGSVTIKGKASANAASAYTLSALGYKDMATSAVATAAITGNALVLVDGSGLNVILDCTSFTSGSLGFVALPLVG